MEIVHQYHELWDVEEKDGVNRDLRRSLLQSMLLVIDIMWMSKPVVNLPIIYRGHKIKRAAKIEAAT